MILEALHDQHAYQETGQCLQHKQLFSQKIFDKSPFLYSMISVIENNEIINYVFWNIRKAVTSVHITKDCISSANRNE